MIQSEEELNEAVEKASELLQDIHEYCGSENRKWAEYPEAKIRFPRGFIRTADTHRRRIPFVNSEDLKSNIAYTLILSDAILWLSIRTDLWGIPQQMLTKVYVFILGSICESVTKNYLHGIKGGGYKPRTAYLAEQEIIDEELQKDLDWLWDTRNNMHLFRLAQREYNNEYNDECHTRAVRTFRRLLHALRRTGRLA
ncbi:MAG: hypothetical protein GVY36_18870 [Verrucomicrobia bacterium]|jgi:hypothetical protein|nr:hypothetical protein [Verrucomicrobiota bacterium]